METIKVNMNPNPLDVQTIHASQNDGEARQWGFKLHNNGELIDTSEITEQMFFKAYKGGTEQLLPENGSTPTTSPFKGDIKYPQGLLTDQEFTYRESPTESDGLAKITDVKGNTIVWNQIFPIQTVNYTGTGYTLTSNNDGKFVLTVTETTSQGSSINHAWLPRTTFTPGHKYLLIGSDATHGIDVYIKGYYIYMNRIWTAPSAMGANVNFMFNNLAPGTYNLYPMIFDLTAMGLDYITSVDEFKSLFPLDYYPFNSGSLIPFMGNGIKTVGKNLTSVTSGNNQILFNAVKGWDYTIAWDADGTIGGYNIQLNGTTISVAKRASWCTFTAPDSGSINFNGYGANVSTIRNYRVYLGTYTEIPSYEPYTSSTLSLPISTYFPNGMDGVGTDYDELTNTKASTRMARVDLGTLPWSMASNNRFISTGIASVIKAPSSNSVKANILCAKYEAQTYSGIVDSGLLGVAINANSPNVGNICIKDTSYTSASDFKSAMSGVYLVYPLATPIETSFTTASLVTENAEIPLSNNDGVLIGKCTEQLSENPGFIDAKIKLSDSDGECYSNKIQLHVERKPS